MNYVEWIIFSTHNIRLTSMEIKGNKLIIKAMREEIHQMYDWNEKCHKEIYVTTVILVRFVPFPFHYNFPIHSVKPLRSRSLAEHSLNWIFCNKWPKAKSFPCFPKYTSSRLVELSTDCKRLDRVVRIRFLRKKYVQKPSHHSNWIWFTIPFPTMTVLLLFL